MMPSSASHPMIHDDDDDDGGVVPKAEQTSAE